ncbi:MAG: peroxiredoxin [Planctomycetia bacterium]
MFSSASRQARRRWLSAKGKTMRRTIWTAALAGVWILAGAATAGELKVGDKAPEFKLRGTDGKDHALADFAGKKAVVVAWFPKAKTGGCTKECKSLRENGGKLKALNVAYFTASCDEPAFNKEFATELDLDYPILSDPEKEAAKAYGVVDAVRKNPARWTFYIDKEGVIRHIDKMVQTTSHGADVAAKLKELGIAD